jgi:hypothetical protein
VIKTLGRLFFVVLGLLLAMIATLFLAWSGQLGAGAEQKLKEAFDHALDFYSFHRESIHAALPWIGAIGSAFWAAFVFARAWHYADQNLPARLAEYNERAAALVAGQRPYVLAQVEQSPTGPNLSTWNISGRLRQRTIRRYVTALDNRSRELDRHIAALDGTRRTCEIERATAHLACGVRHAR